MQPRNQAAPDGSDPARATVPVSDGADSAYSAAAVENGYGRQGLELDGRYRLRAPIGRGGMGEVWLAERINADYQQQVAIKLLTRGRNDAERLRRFRSERQTLASLDHPNIARLLDGGDCDDGTPYLVMEHVDGRRIDSYCREHRLGLRARIALFLDVLAAVQYAHGQLVVHRDIKPDNVLVDAAGRPRLLDFGIAKLLQPAVDGGGDTIDGEQLLTPRYASPEQVVGAPVAIATDVYSLGVLLFELLTGQSPYKATTGSPYALMQMVCSEEPRVASAVLGADSITALGVGISELPRLRNRMKGDLDHILSMCLRKRPQDRYPTVDALAADLRRFLGGYPVEARRGSALYRLRKFVRRRWPLVVAAASVMLVIAIATVMQAQQMEEIRRERDRAEAVLRFAVELFENADPGEGGGESVTVAQALTSASPRVAAEVHDALTRAQLQFTFGKILLGLSLHERAGEFLQAAAASYAEGGDRVQQASVLTNQAFAAYALGTHERALELNARAVEVLAGVDGGDVETAMLIAGHQGLILTALGRYERAIAEQRRGVEHALRLGNSQRLGIAWHNLGHTLSVAGRNDEALPALNEALAVWQRLHDEPHIDTARTLSEIGVQLWAANQPQAAAERLGEALQMRRALLAPDHPDLGLSLLNFAVLQNQLGRGGEAERHYLEAWTIITGRQGERSPLAASTAHNIGDFYGSHGDHVNATLWYEKAWAVRAELPDTAVERGYTASGFGDLLCSASDPARGLPLAQQGAAILEGQFGGDDWRTINARLREANCLRLAGQAAAAGAIVERFAASIEQHYDARHMLRRKLDRLRAALGAGH